MDKDGVAGFLFVCHFDVAILVSGSSFSILVQILSILLESCNHCEFCSEMNGRFVGSQSATFLPKLGGTFFKMEKKKTASQKIYFYPPTLLTNSWTVEKRFLSGNAGLS